MAMEDVLSGKSGHKHIAPLSAGQTIDLVRQIKEELSQLGGAFNDFRKEYADTANIVAALQADARKNSSLLSNLQGSLASTDQRVGAQHNLLGRLDGRVRNAESGFEQTNAKVEAMNDTQQQYKTRLDATQKDAADMRALLKKLQSDLERNFEGDSNDRGEFEEVANKLFRAQDMVTKGIDEQRQMQSALEAQNKRLSNDLMRTGVLIKNLEERFDDAVKNIKVVRRNLDDTMIKRQQLEEDHERTKAKAADFQANARAMQNFAEKLEKQLHMTNNELANQQKQLGSAQEALHVQRTKLQDAEDGVARLGENYSNTGNQLRAIQQRLEETNRVAHTVREGLRETNSLVLPNITMSGGGSGGFGGMGGGDSMGGIPADLRPGKGDMLSTPRSRFNASGR